MKNELMITEQSDGIAEINAIVEARLAAQKRKCAEQKERIRREEAQREYTFTLLVRLLIVILCMTGGLAAFILAPWWCAIPFIVLAGISAKRAGLFRL